MSKIPKGTQPPARILIYCNDVEQKEKLENKMKTLKNKMGIKKNADLLEEILCSWSY